MRRSINLAFLVFLALILSISSASADILFSQADNLYNLGDNFEMKVTVKPVQPVSGFLELSLNCGGESRNFYKEYVSLGVGDEKKISVSFPLTSQFVARTGECNVEANLNEENMNSIDFEVSDLINIILSSDKSEVEPGEKIIISGTAEKENEKQAEGFINIYIPNTDLNVTDSVTNGEFSVEIRMPGNVKSGMYAIKSFVYEKSDTEISNKGNAEMLVKMISVPRRIDIAMEASSMNPGTNATYKLFVYDQAEEEMNGKDVIVRIKDHDRNLAGEKIVKSGSEDSLFIPHRSVPGNWELQASLENLSFTKTISINSIETADFMIQNNTLLVENTGNVPYTKNIQVEIGGEIQIIEIESIPLNGFKKFKLFAPDGTYNVRVSDGVTESSREVPLTGSAINVKGASDVLSFGRYVLVWFFLFAMLGFFIYVTVGKTVPGKKQYHVKESEVEKTEEKNGVKMITEEKQEMKKLSEFVMPQSANPDFAEMSLVLHGEKQNSCLLTLNVKNPEKMEMFKEILGKIGNKIVENKGSIYQSNNFMFGIFAPIVTKTFRNEVVAIKLAEEIKLMLDDYNRKFKEKMNFGLAVHSGELILEKTNGKLKFTSADNTLGMAKRVSDLANNEFLISEDSYKKAGNEIKASKEEKDKNFVYRLQRIIEKNDNTQFIHEFLARNRDTFAKKE